MAFILLLAGGILLTFGDVLMKKWLVADKSVFYILGMIIYVFGLNFLAQSFRFKNIAVASVILVLINVVLLSLVSWKYFGEPLSRMQLLGIVMGLVSIVILELADAQGH